MGFWGGPRSESGDGGKVSPVNPLPAWGHMLSSGLGPVLYLVSLPSGDTRVPWATGQRDSGTPDPGSALRKVPVPQGSERPHPLVPSTMALPEKEAAIYSLSPLVTSTDSTEQSFLWEKLGGPATTAPEVSLCLSCQSWDCGQVSS